MEKSKKPIEFGKVKDRSLTEEIKTSYLDYAMSVIVSRALPDVRDGLKPVQRRILFAMKNLGLGGSSKTRKCAAITGETMGKYHPHGDSSIYDALVRMAQEFSLRYPLVKGQGNFGSIDGDSAAAARYTEAKLMPLSDELFDDIDKDTVDFRDNYDGEYKEPSVLPTKVPLLLLNGVTGIAVGMATNIPPHNITEVMQALVYLADNKDAGLEDLLKFIKGPDFPTAGFAYGVKDFKEAYATGKGKILTRGKMEAIEDKGKEMLLITEIPYGVNKSEMIKKIASLVENKKIIGIKDLRDESDSNIRVLVDLKSGVSSQRIMNQLYKYTDMEKYFYFNCISLVDGGLQPKLLSLKTILEEFICHRKEVIIRRTKFLLKKCQDRLHILDGLKTALDAIDEIIKIIKQSENKEDASLKLRKKFKFSEIQASAILEIKLQALAKLERFKIDNEIKEKNDLIKGYESILNSEKKLIQVMKDEFEYIIEKFGDKRKTVIKNNLPTEISDIDLIPEKDVLLTISSSGYIKRMNNDLFKTQHRGGKGVMMFGSKDNEDVLEKILSVNTKDNL
jgi:DNA gyrase subunit A